MSFADTTVLFILALLLFGPKKLPQIARQVGKALAEFKRASNEFKAQIEAEISQLEFEERRKEQEQKALPKPQPIAESVQSSRFTLSAAGDQVESRTEAQAEIQTDAPAPPQDVDSPAHSTHA
jgi:sec-independent protein translocase protein TatB